MKVSRADLKKLVPLGQLQSGSLKYLLSRSLVLDLGQGARLFDFGDVAPYAYYLISGELELVSADGRTTCIQAGTAQSQFPVGNLVPRQVRVLACSVTAKVLRIERSAMERELAWGLPPDAGNVALAEVEYLPDGDRSWLLQLLRTPVLFGLPIANIRHLFGCFEEVSVRAEETVLQEGAEAHHFFILRRGSARVVRIRDGREIELNRLHEMDAFGGEALITEHPRGASVIMNTDGLLMRIPKKAFIDYMKTPLVRRVSTARALRLVRRDRSRFIDVRTEEEFSEGHLAQARNIPLYLLYLKCRKFVQSHRYIVYCDTGGRSEAAAFLLRQQGFTAYVLDDVQEQLTRLQAATVETE